MSETFHTLCITKNFRIKCRFIANLDHRKSVYLEMSGMSSWSNEVVARTASANLARARA
jgi:hypothetical protein